MSTSERASRNTTAGTPVAPPPVPDLDWSPERAHELAEAVVGLWTELLRELPGLPVTRGETQEEVQKAVALPVPDEPLPPGELVEHLRTVVAHETHIGHPRFLAYIIGSGTVPGAAAELLSAGAVQNAGGWMISPAAHEIERGLVRWLANELGLPETAGGLFVTGGAIGNLVGLKLARDQRAGWDVRHAGLTGPPLAIYTSAEAHDTIDRAADILGLGAAAVRKIDVDSELRMRPDALEARLAEDLKSGSRPIAVVGTAGTTGTGSIDPLPELAAVCDRFGLWLHVDAAYGGPAVLAEDLRPLLAGIERADSVTFDAHKWLYSSAPAGCIIVRNERHLAESFAVDASYIYEDRERTGRGVNAASLAPTFSRGFDALKVWLSLLAHGRNAFARRISHDAALARYLGDLVEARPDFDLAAPVSLSICCFRYRPADLTAGSDAETYLDRLNERLLTELQLDGRAFPSNAVVHGRFALRACITNIRTEANDLDTLLDVAAELGERLDAELRPAALRPDGDVIHDPVAETMPREQLRALQSERLRELARYVYDRVPFSRERFDEAGVSPSDVRSLDDLPRLPFTLKTDLRDHYPFGLFAVPQGELARLHASSGTTGRPTVVGYTRADVELFAEVNARSLAMAGAEPGMMLHNAYGYGLFTGGLGLHYGAERLGMTVVPISGGMTERQLLVIGDFRPEVISCTPSYALTLAQEFEQRGVGPDDLSLRFAVVGAEPWTETMRTAIDAGLGVRASNIYGLSEIIGPGVSCECAEERAGSHVNEDHFYPEIVDPETREPLPEGGEGVLVFTTLTKQALPLVRYWTGDLTSLSSEPCSCGRTLVRMASIKGRTDDMLIIRGVNLFPTQVEEVLGRVPQLSPHYELVVSREGTLDVLEVRAEVTEDYFRAIGIELLSDEAIEADHSLRDLRNRVSHLIKDTIGCTMQVTLAPPGELPRSEGGKLARVLDLRSK